MSLPANRIVAAPFALVGSVGVVTEFPNFHKFLKNLGIEPLTFTAGGKKRNITALSDPDDEEKRQALQDKLESIHAQFQALVLQYRRTPTSSCSMATAGRRRRALLATWDWSTSWPRARNSSSKQSGKRADCAGCETQPL